jgi:hypothetical protein
MSFDGIQDDTIEVGSPAKVSYKDIIIGQFAKCTGFSNVEFRGGYWTKAITKDGSEKSFYNPDTRDIFCNAVYALSLLLKPRYDEIMTEDFKKYNTMLYKLQTNFMKITTVEEEIILGEGYYKTAEDKKRLEEYRQRRLKLHLWLFSKLSEQLHRLNYLELVGGTFE